MRFAFETAINALEAFLILDFLWSYLGFRVKGAKRWWGCALFWIISTASITFFSWNAAFETTSSLTQIAINFVFCLFLLRGSIGVKAFLSAFTMGGIALIAGFTAFLIGTLSGSDIAEIYTQFDSIRLIAILTAKILFFQISRIILRLKKKAHIDKQDAFPLLISPIISIIIIVILTYAAMHAPEVQTFISLAVCLLMVLYLLTYWLFISLARSSQLKSDYQLLALKHASDQQNAADIQNLYEEVRSIRHDMQNHLLSLSRMLEAADCKQADVRLYIQNLLRQQEDLNRTFVFSGNDALDAILNVKQSAAFHAGISFSPVITETLRFMAAEDICVLFGNLLDNAIEAASKAPVKEISLTIASSDEYAMITIRNSIAQSVLNDNPMLSTTKTVKEGHGYGVKNIKKVVQKYSGHLRNYEENDRFITEILLARS